MRLQTISVEKLFGLFDHTIPLRLDDRITIIHGPNGVGKTTILRMISDLFRRRLAALRRTTFEALQLDFDDGTRVRVERPESETLFPDDGSRHNEISDDATTDLIVLLTLPNQETLTLPVRKVLAEELRVPLGIIEREIPQLSRTGPREWFDRATGERLDLIGVAERFSDDMPALQSVIEDTMPPVLSEFLDTASVHFIETQRLFPVTSPAARRRGSSYRDEGSRAAVIDYSAELVEIIEQALAQSARLSQQLDRTLPSRLLELPLPSEATPEAIRQQYQVQSAFRRRLMEAALLDAGYDIPLPERPMEETELRVLWAYLGDTQQKLQVFDELLERIEILKNIINSRFLYKSVAIDSEVGFRFETTRGSDVSPADLSSGEQHELVLAFQLLFKVSKGSLVLIDEPEISLHVTWQQKLLDDLRRVSDAADLDFLLATHSPQIVHDRWDLAVALEGPES